MILAACASQKTQGTIVICIKTPRVREARALGQKSPQKSQKSALFCASCNYSRR
ncbi:hypothetical protein Hanom_Chr08g00723011 [Helianthus anomalus]